MFRLKYGLAATAFVLVAGLGGCSSDSEEAGSTAEPASVEATATPVATPESSPTPVATPDDRSRTERVADHQRQVQEMIRQKQLEQAVQNGTLPPGTETQYN